MTHIFSQVPLPLAYRIGALLYTPANRVSVADSICHQRFGTKFSLALCLEDTINDAYLPQAEQQAIQTIQTIYQKRQQEEFYLPRLFIRLRSPEQIAALLQLMGQAAELLTGFIFPKFSLENVSAYLAALENANHTSRSTPFFMMPVLEDASLLSLRSRVETLEQLKDLLQPYYQQVLNIRVGCNDLLYKISGNCFFFHHVPPHFSLCDIITVFCHFIYSFAEKTILPYIHTKLPDVRQHLWPFLLLIPIFSCPAPSPAQGLRYIRPDHR